MRSISICCRLKLRHLVQIVHRHRTKLQVNIGQRIIHAGQSHRCRLLQAQTLALRLLRVRKSRVNGQHQRRIARTRLLILGHTHRAYQAFSCWEPRCFIGVCREARALKTLTVLH